MVTRSDIRVLRDLSGAKVLIAVDSIPETFKPDFQRYFFGKTLTQVEGKTMAYPHDVRDWVKWMVQKYKE